MAALLLLAALCLTLRWPAPAVSSTGRDPRAATLLEAGGEPAHERLKVTSRTELRIISYNMRWRGGEELRKLNELLRKDAEIGGAEIIGLQEVDRHKKRTDHVNTARLMARELGMYYVWAAPPAVGESEEEETGVAILSRYPMTDVERLVLPHDGPGGRRRAAVGATIHLNPTTALRVYSVHAETRIPVARKMEQLQAVLHSLERRPAGLRAVVLGDFNTIKAKDVRAAIKLFTEAGFSTPLPADRSTWRTFFLELKLDWIWLRGLTATESGIVRRIGFSDHWPLWVSLERPSPHRTTVTTEDR